MKILIVANGFPPTAFGGVEIYTQNLARALKRVINDFKQIDTFADTYLDQNVDEIFLRLMAEFEPDIVHFNHTIALSANLPTLAKS
jgi:glycosyltransferase involved in cell wall biosynthesis